MLKIEPKADPVGRKLVRLADIPLDVRMLAAERCMAEAATDEEVAQLFELVYDPGDRGGRVAA
jgi:hypothetical protein